MYADAETCQKCHEDHADALRLTQHGKRGFDELSEQGLSSVPRPVTGARR